MPTDFSETVPAEVEPRWAMAYAAGLGEADARYFGAQPAVHPLFPVCTEWELLVAAWRRFGMSRDEILAVVHHSHDVELLRPLRSGASISLTTSTAGVAPHRAGTLVVTRFDAADDEGPLWRTWFTALVRGVEVPGPPLDEGDRPPLPAVELRSARSFEVPVPLGAAHVYTACSRIWNPIHTEVAVAEAAGLPAPILHGTATLALGVSRVVEAAAGGDPTRVRRVAGRFGAMVVPPCTLTVEVGEAVDGAVPFAVRTEDGSPAVRQGLVVLSTES